MVQNKAAHAIVQNVLRTFVERFPKLMWTVHTMQQARPAFSDGRPQGIPGPKRHEWKMISYDFLWSHMISYDFLWFSMKNWKIEKLRFWDLNKNEIA